MSKLIIMKGLPASGKSTRAKEIVAQGNTVRINKDLLRTMLHFDKFTGRNEGHTRNAARKLADWFLSDGMNVIIDDTNLNPSTVQSWKDLAKIHNAKIEYIDLTSVEVLTCMEYDIVRHLRGDRSVGGSVILNMALQYGLHKPKKGFVLCDLDGTLCDVKHRLPFVRGVEKKDWKSFFKGISEDTLRESTLKLLHGYEADGYEIIFVTARPREYEGVTMDWLDKNIKELPWSTLIMRRSGDKRPDTEVKQQILDTYFKDKSLIHRVVDDRPSVIRMWREKGLEVVDVGEGKEF